MGSEYIAKREQKKQSTGDYLFLNLVFLRIKEKGENVKASNVKEKDRNV